MNDTPSVIATLDEYAAAYCAKVVERLMTLFSPDHPITVIGTGADKLCAGQDEIRALFQRNFDKVTAERFEWHWREVSIAGGCALVAATLTIHLVSAGEALQVPLRWTACLVKANGKWTWIHRHASAAASSQSSGAAYPGGKHHE